MVRGVIKLYRLASTLEKVYDPHLYRYRLWDRLTDKTIAELWRLAPCKYCKLGGSHMLHTPFIKEHFVLVCEGKEEVLICEKYVEVLRELNNRWFKDDNPVTDTKNIIFMNFEIN